MKEDRSPSVQEEETGTEQYNNEENGATEVLLPRGQTLPAQKEFEVACPADSEAEYRVSLFRGESSSTDENEMIGEITLAGNLALAIAKTKAPATLTISADGLMNVSLKHPLTGKIEDISVVLPEAQASEDVTVIDDFDIVT